MQAIVLLFLNPLILSASSPISPLVYYYLSLNLRQHVLKDLIVMLHTIVQINLNHLIRQRMNFFLILMQFSVLRLHFVQLLSQLDTLAGAGGSGHLFFQTFDGSTVACLLLVDIIGTDARNGVRLVAVQVNQALEAIFLPLELLTIGGSDSGKIVDPASNATVLSIIFSSSRTLPGQA